MCLLCTDVVKMLQLTLRMNCSTSVGVDGLSTCCCHVVSRKEWTLSCSSWSPTGHRIRSVYICAFHFDTGYITFFTLVVPSLLSSSHHSSSSLSFTLYQFSHFQLFIIHYELWKASYKLYMFQKLSL